MSPLLIRKGPAVLELLSGKDKPLLVRRNALFVLDFRLDIIDRIRRLDLEGDRFAGQGFDKDLHTSAKAEDEMEGGLLLNVATRNIGIAMRQMS